jgi:hypothetical protein
VSTANVIKGIRSLPDLKLNDYLLNK